jgi:hypothetical protein
MTCLVLELFAPSVWTIEPDKIGREICPEFWTICHCIIEFVNPLRAGPNPSFSIRSAHTATTTDAELYM